MTARTCRRCNAPLESRDAHCPRCGLSIEAPALAPAGPSREGRGGDGAGPRLVLHQIRPVASDQSWTVGDAAAVVGRKDATIQLTDRSVSRRHAMIRLGPDGRFLVEDASSANGTFINGRAIRGTSEPIASGDELGFGDVVLMAEVRVPAVPNRSLAPLDRTAPYTPVAVSASAADRALTPAMDVTMAEPANSAANSTARAVVIDRVPTIDPVGRAADELSAAAKGFLRELAAFEDRAPPVFDPASLRGPVMSFLHDVAAAQLRLMEQLLSSDART